MQYKYFFENKKIKLKCILFLPKANLSKKPALLLIKQNYYFGFTALTVTKDLKKEFSNCRIIYAAEHIDYSYQKVDEAEVIFYGKLTNEARALSEKERKKKIFPLSYLFPRESPEEEWAIVRGKQFEYGDAEAVSQMSETKKAIKI